MGKIKKIVKLLILCVRKPKTFIKGISYFIHHGPRQFINNMKSNGFFTVSKLFCSLFGIFRCLLSLFI